MTISIDSVSEKNFESPEQFCDIVMKGGITSGIVYPSAILRIAQQYRFKGIGGTSAGAIAAALAAAAEFRRASTNSGIGFILLKSKILDWLRASKNLQSLFVPTIWSAPMFWLCLWIIGLGAAKRKPSLRGGVNIAIAALLTFAILAALVQAISNVPIFILVILREAISLFALLASVWLVVTVLFVMARSNYGMCSGGKHGTISGVTGAEPLTFWLSRHIDAVAHGHEDRPLTFGDLWLGSLRTSSDPAVEPPDEPAIDLRIVTTCLTLGRPYTLPFVTDIFYFHENEFRRYFPGYVVDWMVAHARKPDANDEVQVQRHRYLRQKGFYPLPKSCDLPVVVTARLSLSFPFLMSALRLFAIDFGLANCNPLQPNIEPVWFSDGGLSSNFPISLFDSPIPRWPTLGITLEEFPPGVDQSLSDEQVWLPMDNTGGRLNAWTRFSQGRRPDNVPGFYGAIFNCMQNWQDSQQSVAPGFRDRIAHIRLDKQQGGLNLTMPDDVIAALVDRGELAGERLAERFTIPVPPGQLMTWRNHRWIRLRTTMASFERYAETFNRSWQWQRKPCDSYEALLRDAKAAPSYPLQSLGRINAGLILSRALCRFATRAPLNPLTSGQPKPISDLRARPRY